MLAQAFILGGHCRIGMEDTVHLAGGKPTPSNAAFVEKSVRIIEDLGGKIATAAEARQLLGLAPRPQVALGRVGRQVAKSPLGDSATPSG
jgi:uncharacterized protein (DUF849 family)